MPSDRKEILREWIARRARDDGSYAIAFALLQVSEELIDIGTYIKYLGNGDAATSMGAIENLAKELRDGLGAVSSALVEVAVAVDPK